MPIFIYTNSADKECKSLSKELQIRIDRKLKELKTHPQIFSILKKMEGDFLATHRLRIGSYRLLLRREGKAPEATFLIIKIGDRKDIYR